MEYGYNYLKDLKDKLNTHMFKYEDSDGYPYVLIEEHVVTKLFDELYHKIENEKQYYGLSDYNLYCMQRMLTESLLCLRDILHYRSYNERLYSNVIESKVVNNELDKLIEKYK